MDRTTGSLCPTGRLLLLLVLLLMVLPSMPVHASSLSGSSGSYTHPYPSNIKVGDIVIGHGTDTVSGAIPGYWSHVGIVAYYDSSVNDWIVVEATPERGVSLATLQEFMSRYDDFAVLRVATTDSVRQAAVRFALSQLGKPYDYALWTKQVYGDSYYCSELAWASYKAVNGPDIDANPGFSLKYLWGVAPQEIYDDADTYVVYRHSV